MFGFRKQRMREIDDYAQHASNIRDTVVKHFDYELNKDDPSIEKLQVIVDIFRNFKYSTSNNIKETLRRRMKRATELEFLEWFYLEADFGPADSDVKDQMKIDFIDKTGKNIPEGWNFYSDGETLTDRE